MSEFELTSLLQLQQRQETLDALERVLLDLQLGVDGASFLLRGAHRRTTGSTDAQVATQHRRHVEQRRLHVA
jgi:hypothetical protein